MWQDIYFHSIKRREFKEELGLLTEYQKLVFGRYVVSLHVDVRGDFWIIATYHPGLTLFNLFRSRPERKQGFAHASRVISSDQGTGFFAFKGFRVVSGFMPDQAEQVCVFCRGKAMNVLIYERVYIGLLTRQGGFTILFFDSEGRLLENSTRSMRLPSPFRRMIDGLLDKLRGTPRGQYTYGPGRPWR